AAPGDARGREAARVRARGGDPRSDQDARGAGAGCGAGGCRVGRRATKRLDRTHESLDRTTPLIRSVATPAHARVSIDASDGNRYEADLSSLSAVYCFPPDAAEWSR